MRKSRWDYTSNASSVDERDRVTQICSAIPIPQWYKYGRRLRSSINTTFQRFRRSHSTADPVHAQPQLRGRLDPVSGPHRARARWQHYHTDLVIEYFEYTNGTFIISMVSSLFTPRSQCVVLNEIKTPSSVSIYCLRWRVRE